MPPVLRMTVIPTILQSAGRVCEGWDRAGKAKGGEKEGRKEGRALSLFVGYEKAIWCAADEFIATDLEIG